MSLRAFFHDITRDIWQGGGKYSEESIVIRDRVWREGR